jgi:hypothetical protein
MSADMVIGEIDAIRAGLAHVQLWNMYTGESMDFVINPNELRVQLAVKWKTPSPLLRAPSGPLQYENTEPKEYTVAAEADRELFPQRDIMDWLAFLESLAYPTLDGDVISDPPDVLFVWPGIMAMPCKLTRLSHTFTDFDLSLHPKSFKSDITFQETGSEIRYSDTERTRMEITEGFGG